MKWIVSWTLVPETPVETFISKEKSFEETVLDHMKGPKEALVTKR